MSSVIATEGILLCDSLEDIDVTCVTYMRGNEESIRIFVDRATLQETASYIYLSGAELELIYKKYKNELMNSLLSGE